MLDHFQCLKVGIHSSLAKCDCRAMWKIGGVSNSFDSGKTTARPFAGDVAEAQSTSGLSSIDCLAIKRPPR